MSAKTIQNMVNWVEENLEECRTLEEMSDFVGYSPSYTPFQYRKLLQEILTFDKAQIDICTLLNKYRSVFYVEKIERNDTIRRGFASVM